MPAITHKFSQRKVMTPLYQINHPDYTITITENGRCNISNNQIYDVGVQTNTVNTANKYAINKISYLYIYGYKPTSPSNISHDASGNLNIHYNTKLNTIQTTDYILDSLLRGLRHRWYYTSQNGLSFTCRESAIRYLAYYNHTSLKIDCDLTSGQIDKLHEWTQHHPISLNGRELRVNRWWCNYIRAGWLLLAIRLLSGRQFSQSEKLATKFFKFIKDPNSIKTYMTHSHNWLSIFK